MRKEWSMQVGEALWHLGRRTYVMGILNVTPDSFSDGGRFERVEAAVVRAFEMAREGADIIDVGGESTRPGHTPVDAALEWARIAPVLARLDELPVPVSVDTYKAEVARRAVEAGADLVNDVTGLRGDPAMAETVASLGVPVVIMHWDEVATGPGMMDAICTWLEESMEHALRAGVKEENILVDPGIGFGKDVAGNLWILRHLDELRRLGRPILLGTSRKSVIGRTLDLPVDQRVEGTAATVALGIAKGADVVRVHDVREMVRVARMTDAILGQGEPLAATVERP